MSIATKCTCGYGPGFCNDHIPQCTQLIKPEGTEEYEKWLNQPGINPTPVNQGEKILRWVKASERMPKHHTVFAKVQSMYRVIYCYGGTFYTEHSYQKLLHARTADVEWLEETDQLAAQHVPENDYDPHGMALFHQMQTEMALDVPDTNVGDIAESSAPTKEGAEIPEELPIPIYIENWFVEKSGPYECQHPTRGMGRSIFESGAYEMYQKLQPEINALQSALSSMTAERDEGLRVQKDLTEVILKLTAENEKAHAFIISLRDAANNYGKAAKEEIEGLKAERDAARQNIRTTILSAIKWTIEINVHREGPYWGRDYSSGAYTDENIVDEFLKSNK